VLKPASATIQCGIEIENIANKIGLPEGIFQTIIGSSSIVKDLIDSEFINAVTFTGSVKVGSLIASQATSKIKKCVLELGGSDPFIVCKDADIEKAAIGAVKGRFINCGQSCIASKRLIVVEDVKDEFLEKFVSNTESLRIGNPESDDTDIGPMVNFKALEKIDSQVKDAVKEGGEIILGGERIDKDGGYFYQPTIIKNVTSKMRLAQDEVFGPVAPILTAKDENEALKIANDSEYGLGASIWTEDLVTAEKLAENIQAGVVSVNNVVASDPRVPFGGIKKSGFGRELSRFGMLEFVNIKSVRLYDQLYSEHRVE
jgi:acyl-CoA reductase-like NAD-dependent aldehyde dehydrogenase